MTDENHDEESPALKVEIINKDKPQKVIEEFPDEEFTIPEYITEEEIKEFEKQDV